MGNYYFSIAALPPLEIGMKPELSTQELKEMLALNLTPDDSKQVAMLLRTIDLANVRALWLGRPLDERGNLRAKELEEALLVKERIPSYLIDFLERYEGAAERLRYFPSLLASLYREGSLSKGRFLPRYFQLEREVRLVLTALRAKRWGRDVVKELQFEDPYDPFVAAIFAQKDAADYTPPQEYEDLKALFLSHLKAPKELELEWLKYRFRKIEEMEEPYPFALDQLLGYLARLLLVESWVSLNEERALQKLAEIDETLGMEE